MQCPLCKSEINAGATVCANCGAQEIEAVQTRTQLLGCGMVIVGIWLLIGVAYTISVIIPRWSSLKKEEVMFVGLPLALMIFLIRLWNKPTPSKRVWVILRKL